MVFHAEWHFLPRSDRLTVYDPCLVRAREDARERSDQHERGHPIHTTTRRDERVSRTGVLYDALRLFAQRISTRFCAERLSQRSRDVHVAAGVIGRGIDLWGVDRGGHGKVK